MKTNDIACIYETYKNKSAGSLSPDEQEKLKSKLESFGSINNKQEAQQFLELLSLLRKAQVKSMAGLGEFAMETITDTFATEVYSADSLLNARFIYELVQNVDDCKFKNISDCKLNIEFNFVSDAIRLEYNETGFEPENIIAITGLGGSTKNHKKAQNIKSEKKLELDQNDLQEIGEKGIGFKSIFGLAKSVKISSRYFSFKINRDCFFVPVVDDYKEFKYTDGTILELMLDDGMAEELFEFLQEKYGTVGAVINENPILFLNKLTEIKYSKSKEEYFGFRVSRNNVSGKNTEEKTTIEYFSSDTKKNRMIDAYRFSRDIEYSVEECKARYGEQEDSIRKHKIIIIAPEDPNMIKKGRIYSFFATSEVIHAPFIIHAPFRLNSGRIRIDSQSQSVIRQNKWFTRTQNETIRMIHFVFERLAEILGNQIRYYVPDDCLVDTKCALFSHELEKKNILKWRIFEDISGNHWPASQVCMLDYPGSINQLSDIYHILELNKKLLKIDSNEIESFRHFTIEEIGDIRNKLLKCALTREEKTTDCFKYISDYEPDFSISSISGSKFNLTYGQLIVISDFAKISAWINQHTFDLLISGKNGVKIESEYTRKPECTDMIRNFCREYGESINKAFITYLNRSKYYDVPFKNTIYLYDRIFGNSMVEDFAEIYHKLEPKDKFFYPFLKIEAISAELDKLCNCSDERSDYEFLKSLQQHRKSQKIMLKDQYDNILNLFEKSGTSPERFFLEILQNIDDCEYESEPYTEICCKKSDDTYVLSFKYNERGFTRKNIRAITAIGDSTKKKLLNADTTGEKGVGFKTVFSICSHVRIKSGHFCFRLSAEKPTIPEYIKEIDHFAGTQMDFTLYPKDAEAVLKLLTDEERIIKNCLCLKKLHQFKINQKELVIANKNNRRIIRFDKNTYEFFKYTHSAHIHSYLLQSKDNHKEQVIEYLIPLNFDLPAYHVYVTLPTQEKITIPMIINTRLELNTARERIQECEKNRQILRLMHKGLIEVYEKLKFLKKEKLIMYFPREGRVSEHKYGHSSDLLCQIADKKLFKLALKNDFVSLKIGVFSHDFEYYLFEKFGKYIKSTLPDILLAKDEVCFDRLKCLFDKKVRERSFLDVCQSINILFDCTTELNHDIIADDDFRGKLYNFLSDSSFSNQDVSQNRLIRHWKIIPIKHDKKTTYVNYSTDIYAPGKHDIDSEKYKILDTKKLSTELFDKIYSRIDGKYKSLQTFSKDVIVDEFFSEVCWNLKTGTLEDRAVKVLDMYNAEKNLFEEMIKSRKDFPADSVYFKTRTNKFLNKRSCFICKDPKSQDCLDAIIVSSEYADLATLIGIPLVDEISSYEQILFSIGRKELAELAKNKHLSKKESLFSSLYLSDEREDELNDGLGFFELYVLTPDKVKKSENQSHKTITLTEKSLKRYDKEINEISVSKVPIQFVVDFELPEFEKDNILSEIEDELQIRKETDRIKAIMEMLSNCYYAHLKRKEPCCIRTKDKKLLLLNSKIKADYDIIESLKNYFFQYFKTELSINRNIRLYNRRGFDNISTIDSLDKDVEQAVEMMRELNMLNEEIKDFLCRPLSLNGITYGGYAKTCPLCGARVETELTGMRIYKTKINNTIIPLISCCNCHENLRYASDISIDLESLKKGILNMVCQINEYEWKVTNKKIRLGHRALIRKMNQK